MKVYLAGQYARRDEFRTYRDDLKTIGIECTSRWLEETHDPKVTLHDMTDNFKTKTAVQDLKDIQAADVMVFFAENPLVGIPRGGRHVEFGYAIGLQTMHAMLRILAPSMLMPPVAILVVGAERENIFHYLDGIPFVPTWEDAKKWLLENKKDVDLREKLTERIVESGAGTPLAAILDKASNTVN